MPEEVKTIDGVRYHLSRWTSQTHLFKRVTVQNRDDDRTLTSVERVARFTLDDFRQMWTRCGLRLEGTLGDYDLSPFDTARSSAA